jgi:hypothetical protein
VKLLMFQARRFAWTPFEQIIKDADAPAPEEVEVSRAAVIFIHAEQADQAAPGKTLTKTLKNTKWVANKRGLNRVVLHSFTHLGGDTAEPAFARQLLLEAAERLLNTGYEVWVTPFGWVCTWELTVYGESLAKVFKSF